MRKLLSVLWLAFCLLLGFHSYAYADLSSSSLSTDISVDAADTGVILGDSGEVSITVTNPSSTAWLYNLNLEVILDNGMTFVPPSDPAHASVESIDDAGAMKEKITWQDLTDLAPGQTYTMEVPVKILQYYEVDADHSDAAESTGFNTIAAVVYAYGSSDPYYFDEIYNTDTFNVNVMPFSVTASSPGKQLKGAGSTEDATDNFNTFSNTITVKNNDYFSSVVDLAHVLPNGVEISDLTTVFSTGSGTVSSGTVDPYNAIDGKSSYDGEISRDPGAMLTISDDSAVFENETSGGMVNSGD
jgi:hypothetical protein